MFLKKRKILLILASLIGIYLFSSIGFYLIQEKFIFQPVKLKNDYRYNFEIPFQEYTIQTRDGEKLNAVVFPPTESSKGLILYFHGNADNLQRWGNYAIDFTKLGYTILMVDYRSYGKSTGIPSERDLYLDATTVLEWAQKNISYQKLIYYGRSLGSAVASQLATRTTPDLLILETPFNELKDVVYQPVKFLLSLLPTKYSFNNHQYLPKVKCRKIIFHGSDDWVVPLASAEKLKPLLSGNDQFYIITGAGHRNLRDFPEFHRALAEVLK